jgi:hypothetical protein
MQAIDGVETLGMEWRPTDEESDDDSNWNQKKRTALEGRRSNAKGSTDIVRGLAGSRLRIQIVHCRKADSCVLSNKE